MKVEESLELELSKMNGLTRDELLSLSKREFMRLIRLKRLQKELIDENKKAP